MGTIEISDGPWWGEFFPPIHGVIYALKRAVVSCGTAGELPRNYTV